jgi:hypothetical protein
MSLSSFSVSTSTTIGHYGRGASAHSLVFEIHAFRLDSFDELDKGIRADDADLFGNRLAAEHAPQPAPERLLRKDFGLRRVRPEADDRHHVLHVPPFAQHHHRDDRLVGAVPAIDFATLLAKLA